MNALVRLAAWILAIGLVALPVIAVFNGWIAADRWPMRQARSRAWSSTAGFHHRS